MGKDRTIIDADVKYLLAKRKKRDKSRSVSTPKRRKSPRRGVLAIEDTLGRELPSRYMREKRATNAANARWAASHRGGRSPAEIRRDNMRALNKIRKEDGKKRRKLVFDYLYCPPDNEAFYLDKLKAEYPATAAAIQTADAFLATIKAPKKHLELGEVINEWTWSHVMSRYAIRYISKRITVETVEQELRPYLERTWRHLLEAAKEGRLSSSHVYSWWLDGGIESERKMWT